MSLMQNSTPWKQQSIDGQAQETDTNPVGNEPKKLLKVTVLAAIPTAPLMVPECKTTFLRSQTSPEAIDDDWTRDKSSILRGSPLDLCSKCQRASMEMMTRTKHLTEL
ncbi:hypothetical protein N7475_002732 [Penicillium sp. IBT 31633x]|nr:hypothetical protein N7475_002732 [Penicillium sp. IBT 31633x]